MSTDFIMQQIPLWASVHPNVQRSILKKGSLANQKVKRPYSRGCDKGGECLSCTFRPCGRPISCYDCKIKHCTYELPCVGLSNHERGEYNTRKY